MQALPKAGSMNPPLLNVRGRMILCPKIIATALRMCQKTITFWPRQSNVRVMFQILTSLSSLLSIAQSDFIQAYAWSNYKEIDSNMHGFEMTDCQ